MLTLGKKHSKRWRRELEMVHIYPGLSSERIAYVLSKDRVEVHWTLLVLRLAGKVVFRDSGYYPCGAAR